LFHILVLSQQLPVLVPRVEHLLQHFLAPHVRVWREVVGIAVCAADDHVYAADRDGCKCIVIQCIHRPAAVHIEPAVAIIHVEARGVIRCRGVGAARLHVPAGSQGISTRVIVHRVFSNRAPKLLVYTAAWACLCSRCWKEIGRPAIGAPFDSILANAGVVTCCG
jgi:hypothetical protein